LCRSLLRLLPLMSALSLSLLRLLCLLSTLCRPVLSRLGLLSALYRPVLRLLSALCRPLLGLLSALARSLLLRCIMNRPVLRRLCRIRRSCGLICSIGWASCLVLCCMGLGRMLTGLTLIWMSRSLLLCLRFGSRLHSSCLWAHARVNCGLNNHLNLFLIGFCFSFLWCNLDNFCLRSALPS
jgi:hypothetical protein